MAVSGRAIAGVGVAAVVLIGAITLLRGDHRYHARLVLPSAAQLVEQAQVQIDGHQVGSVTGIEARDGKAIVTLSLDDSSAPLHDGTTSRIEWESVLGERVVQLYPGPASNAALPDNAILDAASAQIEVDQVLSTFDAPTRAKLNSLLAQLNGTATGREEQLKQTLDTAGPAVNALGSLLAAIGRDGPAIRELLIELHQVTGPLAQRGAEVRGAVNKLTAFTGQLAPTQEALREGLQETPSTLDAAKGTLDMVPAATDATVPLLKDLRPATERLPAVARKLNPLLDDLRPTLHDLNPTLRGLGDLLDHTPRFLDASHDFLPQVKDTLAGYREPIAFLRPYSPELIGFLTNWGDAFSGYDSQGHVWSAAVSPLGGSSDDESLTSGLPSGIVQQPAPGALVGQPWTDADGHGMR
jgi:phospholipid/cholesterol/gamma-HCH transport system substrate-binding protein